MRTSVLTRLEWRWVSGRSSWIRRRRGEGWRGGVSRASPSESSENICSMTSDGSAYSRFRRALDTGNELLVITAARELPQIALDDALRICLVLRGGDPERYERAAVRWLGRFALEARGVTIEALRAAADALDALPERATEAMEQLQALCVAHDVR
jgi:hypothetical protein